MAKYLLLLTTALLLLGGCSEDSTGPSSNGVIMPLAVGNQWVYKMTWYKEGGMMDTTYLDTVRITQTDVYKGDTIYIFNNGPVGANRADGYYVISYNKLQLLVKYPTYSGEVFRRDTSVTVPEWDINLKDTDITTFSCKEINSFTNIPAGGFFSNKYLMHWKGIYRADKTTPPEKIENLGEYYYAPGIGEIKSLYYAWKDTLVLAYKTELVSYHLN